MEDDIFEHDLSEKFKNIESEIHTISDDELDETGQNTELLLLFLSKIKGENSKETQNCKKFLEVLKNEWKRRHAPEQAKPKPAEPKKKIKVPNTYYELMSQGDGSVK